MYRFAISLGCLAFVASQGRRLHIVTKRMQGPSCEEHQSSPKATSHRKDEVLHPFRALAALLSAFAHPANGQQVSQQRPLSGIDLAARARAFCGGRHLHMSAAEPRRCVIIGGTGRIGTAMAAHLIQISSRPVQIVLAGRDPARGAAAVQEVIGDASAAISSSGSTVTYEELDWRNTQDLAAALAATAVVVHTAGPYAGEKPEILKAAIAGAVPVYVDLSDPVDYLDAAQSLDADAQGAGTLAMCAAGAFPGLSNVLAMECSSMLGDEAQVKNIDFNYFTAGLGGSGEINLLITNEGFGDNVPVYRGGTYSPQLNAGSDLRRVQFYLNESEPSYTLVGEKTVWNWPFPEGKTVAGQMNIAGDSSVGMGTAPEIWNTIMGAMCAAVPREWWRSRDFSLGLARFSRPLVAVTDAFVGETHAMRIDVTSVDGARVSAVQAHSSFRRVVGQSCAEFTNALLEGQGKSLPASGVYLPEQLFASPDIRAPMLKRLLSVEGTLNYGFEVVPSTQSQKLLSTQSEGVAG